MTNAQRQVLAEMAVNPSGENARALPFSVVYPLEQQGLIRYARTTRWARITYYRITKKGRDLLGAESL